MARNQLLRLIVIDDALRTGRSFHSSELAQRCKDRYEGEGMRRVYTSDDDVAYSERTIRNDIRMMREHFGAPIPKRNLDQRYTYTDPNFSLFQNVRFAEEIQTLRLAAQVLAQFKGLPLGDDLLRLDERSNDLNVINNEQRLAVAIEAAPDSWAQQWLGVLFKAIVSQKTTQVTYQPFDKPRRIIKCLPLQLKLFNRRWFLYALVEDASNQISAFALDRILEVVLTSSKQNFPDTTHFDTLHTHLFGVSYPYDSKPEYILLAVSKPRAYYLKSKPIHPLQKVESENDHEVVFSYNLFINRELIAELLHYLEDLRILEPLALKSELVAICQNFLSEK
jgi:predicted DNA-binding transcriptional regulator YafY